MSKRKKVDISFRCERCGKPQKPSKELSTENLTAFDCHEKCECGGKFVMFIGDDKIG